MVRHWAMRRAWSILYRSGLSAFAIREKTKPTREFIALRIGSFSQLSLLSTGLLERAPVLWPGLVPRPREFVLPRSRNRDLGHPFCSDQHFENTRSRYQERVLVLSSPIWTEAGPRRVPSQRGPLARGNQPDQFGLKRKGREATNDETRDENGEPEANSTKMIRLRHGRTRSSWLWSGRRMAVGLCRSIVRSKSRVNRIGRYDRKGFTDVFDLVLLPSPTYA